MSVRQVISKAILPSLERDLSRSFANELANAGGMVDTFLAPQVYGYTPAQSRTGGAFGATPKVEKVNFTIERQGMFQDVEGH